MNLEITRVLTDFAIAKDIKTKGISSYDLNCAVFITSWLIEGKSAKKQIGYALQGVYSGFQMNK
jgi:hypothetical protein